MRPVRIGAILISGLAVAALARAGGAWVPDPGDGWIQLGYSQKTAHNSYDVRGDLYTNRTNREGESLITYHDFRYGYLSGEAGIVKNLSAGFLLTYLDGTEGADIEPYHNRGLSDAWFTAKYQFQRGRLPMAAAVSYRTAFFYDQPGDYDRWVYNDDGTIRGENSEWRGLLKDDLTVSYLVSHSFLGGGGWANLELSYTWRAGAPADQIPVFAEVGYPLPILDASVKVAGLYVRSRYNKSARQPDDRFGSGAVNDFNAASMARIGGGVIVPLGRGSLWAVEAGYNAWVWGRSARRYREPYFSVGRRF
jgi:hypothetical protein